jgi:hypothetical protein
VLLLTFASIGLHSGSVSAVESATTFAASAGGTGGDRGVEVSVLADGSAIVTGWFAGTATFGDTTLTSAGFADVFVAKISAGGGWLWATAAGGTGNDRGHGVSVLADGSAIVTGWFAGTATFGDTTLTSPGGNDVFVAKISAGGDWLWATSAGGTGNDEGRRVSVLADGSAIVTGSFTGTATFGATTPLTSAGFADVFVAKISAGGAWLWATAAGGTGSDEGRGVSVLADGSAIVTGWFVGTATFGATTPLTSPGGNDVFVAKIGAGGTWVWATSAGGTGNDEAYEVSVLADGSAIVTGWFAGTATFGATTLNSAGSNDDDVFVAKMSADGAWVWATSAGGTGNDRSYGVSVLADGSAIVTGSFTGTATFGATTPLTSAGSNDVFVAKVSAGGDWLWATSAGGTGSEEGYTVSVLADGSAIVTGYFTGTATFGDTTLTSANDDVFVAKITASGRFDAATQIAVQAGNDQTAAVGTQVATPPSVIVRDANNNPVSGVEVIFAVATGGGTIDPASPATVSTDANGVAALTSWTLGAVAGANTLTVTAPGLTGSPVTFTATGYGAATQIAVQAGNNPTAVVGTQVATAPSVVVRDASNIPVPGVSMTFAVGVGGGTISPASPATVTTDANGVAALTSWTLGTTAGMNTLTATVDGLTGSPVVFSAMSTPPPPPPPVVPELVTDPVSTVPSSSVPSPRMLPPATSTVPAPAPVPVGGVLPSLVPGVSQVLVDGVPESVEVFVEASTDVVVRGEDFELRVAGECSAGCTIETSSDGRLVLTLEERGVVNVSGEGFLAGTPVFVWLFSEPKFLGELTVLADGTFAGSVALGEIAPGGHTLQVNGTSFDGRQRTVNLGVLVNASGVSLPATGSDAGVLVWALVLVVVGVTLVAVTRRRVYRISN